MKMFNEVNTILTSVDSYKVSHWLQYPENTEEAQFYIESRGGKFDEVVTAGPNYITKLLSQPVTKQQVLFAQRLYKAHFGKDIFNLDSWLKIAELGYLPVKFSAIPEGTVVPVKNVVARFESKGEFSWLAGWLETMAVRGVWYPSSVATLSRECKKVIDQYMTETSDLHGAEYDFVLHTRLHDFGARGASSSESAAIGGLAHLYNFMGTDTVEGMILAISMFEDAGSLLENENAEVKAAGISIPAREHSTTISYGRENEQDAYLNSVRTFGEGVYANVYDSWSFKTAVAKIIEYSSVVIAKGGTLVVRPDSGDMLDNIMYALNKLGEIFGYEYNSKGYKVLSKHVRIIQGDEIHGPETIARVLSWMESHKWAAENIAFGMGGGLLQEVTRDTQKYAMKMSAIKINGEWRGVYKCPEGAEWKKSKAGLLETIVKDGVYKTVNTLEQFIPDGWSPALVTYYDNGWVNESDTLQVIRERARI
ncbi:nicotinamide phosphoribosyltransferase [Pantoea phage Phynn]|nr:nicotinamide phosphoribosyltransferase [Pantoea phage Phynn]